MRLITVATLVAAALCVAQLASAAASPSRAKTGPNHWRQGTSFVMQMLTSGRTVQNGRWRRKARSRPKAPRPRPAPSPQPAPVPDAPAAGYRGKVGMSAHVVWIEDDAEQLAYLRRLREGGVTWIRDDFSWGAHERSKGVWNWTHGDRLMRNAAKAGVNVLPILGYSAPWATSGSTIYHAPRSFDEYANYAKTVVDRYGADGTFWRLNPALTPHPFKAVELWNEPWHHDFWRPNPDPAAYARLVRAATVAIHGSHPEVKVLASGDVFQMRADTSASVDWFRLVLEADPALFKDHVDGYAVHLYTEDRGPLDKSVDQRWRFDRLLITRSLAQSRNAGHPIWVTEFGWSTNSGPDTVSEATQASFVRAAFGRTVNEWGSFVPVSFLYHWGKPAGGYDGGYGMLRPDGSAKPAWGALSALLG